MQTEPVNPWYREPWPWFILGILGLGVFFGISILTIGLNNPPQLVSGEYERLGRGMIDTGERTARARSLGLDGSLQWTEAQVQLILTADDQAGLPEQLLLRLQHPVDAQRDQSIVLTRQEDSRYMGELTVVNHNRSTVILSDLEQTWWISGRLTGNQSDTVRLIAQRL